MSQVLFTWLVHFFHFLSPRIEIVMINHVFPELDVHEKGVSSLVFFIALSYVFAF